MAILGVLSLCFFFKGGFPKFKIFPNGPRGGRQISNFSPIRFERGGGHPIFFFLQIQKVQQIDFFSPFFPPYQLNFLLIFRSTSSSRNQKCVKKGRKKFQIATNMLYLNTTLNLKPALILVFRNLLPYTFYLMLIF